MAPGTQAFPIIFRPILAGIVCLFWLWGCASSHYVGYIESPHRTYGLVSKNTEKEAKNFELKCIRALLAADKFELEKLMSRGLYEKIGEDSLGVLLELLQNRNKVSGKYFITHNQLNLKKSLFDKGAKRNGFDHYDYIMVRYIIDGYQESYLYLFMTRKAGFYKLCGLRLQDLEYSELGRRLDLSWLSL